MDLIVCQDIVEASISYRGLKREVVDPERVVFMGNIFKRIDY